jgi:hypothetical protein
MRLPLLRPTHRRSIAYKRMFVERLERNPLFSVL